MKPQPVVVETVCSECGLDWDLHGDKPTLVDCIRLLRDELARRSAPSPVTITYPIQPVYPGYPWQQWWTTCGGGSSGLLTTNVIDAASS